LDRGQILGQGQILGHGQILGQCQILGQGQCLCVWLQEASVGASTGLIR